MNSKVNKKLNKKLLNDADKARIKVSGYSSEKKKALLKRAKSLIKPPKCSESFKAFSVVVKGRDGDWFAFTFPPDSTSSIPFVFRTRTEATKYCIELQKHLDSPCRVVKISAEFKTL